ncbi:MAG: sugar phosphate isomerase/epimerase [Hungatella sp.]|jgi:sugar phosphate isomerase/epimerase|nr:sugar phosphate isomerase/epimerase [Hungatella sp.]
MILATSTNIYCEQHNAPNIPMEQSIRTCAAVGYMALDFGFVELTKQPELLLGKDWKQGILQYKELADSLQVDFVQAHATIYDFCNPSGDASRLEQMMRRSIEGASLLGAPWIVVHPSTHIERGEAAQDTHEMNVQFFQDLADYAKQFGVGIAIENMWGKTAEKVRRYAIDAQELVDLVDAVDRPNIGACWDTEHASIEDQDQAKSIRLLGSRLKCLHVSDESGPDAVHILPYMGRISWPEILQALADIGYQNSFTFEMQHYLPGVPAPLVLSAMRLSVETGNYMIAQINAMRRNSL